MHHKTTNMAQLKLNVLIDVEGDKDVPLDIQKSIADRVARAIASWSQDNGLIGDKFYEGEEDPASLLRVTVTLENDEEMLHEVRHNLM